MNYASLSKAAAGVLLVAMLSACGGGGGSTPVAAVPAPTTFTVAGTAATGAALDGATITITGSDGTTYPAAGDPPVLTGTDGSYTVTLPLTAKPPFVVSALRNDISLVSVVPEAKDTTTNITPVTNLIASRLSSSGDPSKLAAEIQADPSLIDLAKVTAKVAEVVALIQPLMDAIGDSTDPLNGNIQAAVQAGTGADKLLDSLAISITPSSDKTVNIEVSVKQKLAEGEQPTVVAFSGGTGATAPAAALPTVAATDLVPSGNAALIDDFLKRMTACYALPQAERVKPGGNAAADIIAPTCLDIFSGQDPTKFLSSGSVVGNPGAYAAIFFMTDDHARPTFDLGSYEFTRGDGDLVIAFRGTSGADLTYYTGVLRQDADGKLRSIGNQYKYNGAVNAYHQLRTFINETGADYYSTGYNLYVSQTADVATVVKVVVTSPKGNTFLLRPLTGSAYFPMIKVDSAGKETQTATSFLRLERAYVDSANSADPQDADATNNFFSKTRYADADIVAIPKQARWKFDYYSSETTIDATQYFTTRSRAMTIPEMQTQSLATLTADTITGMKNNTKVNASGGLYWPTPVSPDLINLSWEVPAGALAPTQIQAFGGATVKGVSIKFNDSAAVASSATTGTIACSGADHCTADGHFLPGGIGGVHLWATTPAGQQFAHYYSVSNIVIP
jgi:hypothetical protein